MAAPMAQPTITSSAIGVSTTRIGPNRSSKPSVTRYAPPKSPMSSPIRNMVSSRSISSRSASRRAARNRVSGIAVHLPLARVQVAVKLVDGRVCALVREANDLLDLACNAALDLLEVCRRRDPRLLQLKLEEDHRVAVAPPLLLVV